MASISPTSRPGYVYDSATDTWIPIGIGPHTHQATDLSGVVDDALIDAKGDLIVGSAADTPARLAVGNNGETLVADSSATTGLRWQGNFAAGKNKIINGDFNIWQRGAGSFTTNGAYTADRFAMAFGGTGTAQTVTRESFTAGTAPVAGYEAQYFCRNVVTGGSGTSSLVVLQQKVEDVRTFAGQTVTVSFWAKANTGTPSIGLDLYQDFGSGGSSTVSNGGTKVAITTSWARYSATISIASISGKTIGTGNFLGVRLWFSSGSDYNSLNNSLGIQSATFDVWGVQVEAGSVATAFQTATGTLAGELAACQRYFYRTTFNKHQTWARDTNIIFFQIKNPVYMRSNPSVSTTITSKVATTPTTTAQVAFYYGSNIAGTATLTMGTDSATTDEVSVYFTGATFTQGVIPTAEFAGAYFDVSSEL